MDFKSYPCYHERKMAFKTLFGHVNYEFPIVTKVNENDAFKY